MRLEKMNRIIVIGCGGAGKSTFSKNLHKYLKNHELIHLDTIYWKPNWVATPEDDWALIVEKLSEKDKWIIDGNHDSTLNIRLKRADTIIFLDKPRNVCMKNAVKRTLKGKLLGIERDDITKGCNERFDPAFYKFVWNYNKEFRPKYINMLDNFKKDKQVFILKNNKEVNFFLHEIKKSVS